MKKVIYENFFKNCLLIYSSILILLGIFVFPINTFSQNINNQQLQLNAIKKHKNGFEISAGIGFAKAFQLKSDVSPYDYGTKFLFVVDSRFVIYKALSLRIGIDVNSNVQNSYYTDVNVYLMPQAEIHIINNKFNLLLGAGGTLTLVTPQSGLLGGLIFSVRPEFMFNNKFGIGVDFKHINYLGEEYTNYFLTHCHLFYKFIF